MGHQPEPSKPCLSSPSLSEEMCTRQNMSQLKYYRAELFGLKWDNLHHIILTGKKAKCGMIHIARCLLRN